jgi:anaerobic C4-dicarboxylate transporter-like protein
MDLIFFIQFFIVMACIGIGGRYGGMGLGAGGGMGVLILVLGFGLKPSSPSITAILIIIAVIGTVSVLQAAGGLDYLVRIAEKILRKKPQAITFVAPIVTSIFTLFCGTTYVAFSLYPVIAEVSAEAKVRPERSLSATVIAASVAVAASPMSAATAGMVAILHEYAGVTLGQIMAVVLPSFFLAAIITSFSVYKRGLELEQDPEFQRRVAAGEYESLHGEKKEEYVATPGAKKGVAIFGLGVLAVLILGSFTGLLPPWDGTRLSTPMVIQMVMLSAALLIMIVGKVPSSKLNQGSVFRAGLMGVVAILGVSWMTATFFDAYQPELMKVFGNMISGAPMLFGIVVFIFSLIIMSPAATVAAIIPLGVSLGIPAPFLIAMYPCTCGDFIIPGANQIGCVAFDRTGTTKIGRFVINHSYLRPGFVMVISQVILAYFMTKIVF